MYYVKFICSKSIVQILFLLLIFISCTEKPKEDDSKNGNPFYDEKVLGTIPDSCRILYRKFNEKGNSFAMVVQEIDSIQLITSNFPPKKYIGRIFFDEHGGFRMVKSFIDDSRELHIANDEADHAFLLAWNPLGNASEYLQIDKNGEHIAYAAYEGGKWRIYNDFKPDPLYDFVSPPKFSENGKTLCYIAKSNQKHFVVSNNINGKVYDHIFSSSLNISSDGGTITYIVKNNGSLFFVKNEIENGPYKAIVSLPLYSNNGERYAYIINENDYEYVVLDGVKQKGYDEVLSNSLRFSNDGKHFAYSVKEKDKSFYIVDGEEELKFDGVSKHFNFSPNNNEYNYCGYSNKRWYQIINGVQSSGFDLVGSVIYSDNGKHWLYGYKVKAKWHLNINDKNKIYLEGTIVNMSIDDKGNYSYIIKTDDKKEIAYFNHHKSAPFISCNMPIYSPTTNTFAFIGRDKAKLFVIKNGADSLYYDIENSYTTPTFDSKGNLIFARYNANKWDLIVNDKTMHEYDNILLPEENKFHFKNDNSIEFLAIKSNQILNINFRN